MEQGVGPGHIISPKLFTTRTNIETLDININDEKLSHSRYSDALVLITDHFKEAQRDA